MVRSVRGLWRKKDVSRIMKVWGVFSSGQRESAYFLAQHTLQQVGHLVASKLGKSTTIIAW